VWHFFGRERTFEDIPDALSVYPKERKGWEVAAFFNPPFADIDQNFSSTMLLELYRRKVIDIKMKDKGILGKDMLIKINSKKNLDNAEEMFIEHLELIKELSDKKYIEDGYLNIEKALSSATSAFKPSNKSKLQTEYLAQTSYMKKTSKTYMDTKGNTILLISLCALIFIGSIGVLIPPLFVLSFVSLFILVIVCKSSALFIKFKEDYYIEYLHWHAFKKWLSGFPSMKQSPPEAVVLWEKYLVYAAALGVASKVAKQLKNWGVIDDRRYNMVVGVSHFSSASFGSSGSGGAGGGGGGGAGGGGGGGR
jgi:uncharacterized membrane protein